MSYCPKGHCPSGQVKVEQTVHEIVGQIRNFPSGGPAKRVSHPDPYAKFGVFVSTAVKTFNCSPLCFDRRESMKRESDHDLVVGRASTTSTRIREIASVCCPPLPSVAAPRGKWPAACSRPDRPG
jgi:hypothetical protein